MVSKEHRKARIGLIFSWIFGAIFIFSGLGALLSKELIGALALFIMGSVLTPPINRFISNKIKFELSSKRIKALVLIIGFVIIAVFIDTEETSSSIQGTANQQGISTQSPTSTKDILNKCKCREYCYGEKIYDYCLHENVETSAQCKELVGTYLGRSYDGSVEYYFDEKQLDTCYKSLISRQTNANLCSQFPVDYSHECFFFIGKRNFEPKHCKELPYSYKSDCYLYISKNPNVSFSVELCNELNKDDKTKCYANVAINEDNSRICLGLEDDNDKILCHNMRGYSKSFSFPKKKVDYAVLGQLWLWEDAANFDAELFNKNYCKVIDGGYECYTEMAIFNKDFSLCKELPRESGTGDQVRTCTFYTALWTDSDFEDCDKLGVDYKECYEGVILSSRNPDLCFEKYDAPKQQNCIFDMAANRFGRYEDSNILLCRSKLGVDNYCVKELYSENPEFYEKSSNPEVCKILRDSGTYRVHGEKCLYRLALEKLDISLCEEIEEGNPMRTDCQERVEHA